MKFSSIATMILISSILLIAPTQGHLPKLNLIEQICHSTPHYHLCVLTLKTQQLMISDIAACARVILKVMIAKAPVVLDRIQKTIGECNNQPELKTALEGCSNSYTQITKELLPKAMNCMDKGDYNGAKEGASAAGELAASCASKCNSKTFATGSISPLGESNQYLQNMCSITVSIITQVQVSQSNHQTLN